MEHSRGFPYFVWHLLGNPLICFAYFVHFFLNCNKHSFSDVQPLFLSMTIMPFQADHRHTNTQAHKRTHKLTHPPIPVRVSSTPSTLQHTHTILRKHTQAREHEQTIAHIQSHTGIQKEPLNIAHTSARSHFWNRSNGAELYGGTASHQNRCNVPLSEP